MSESIDFVERARSFLEAFDAGDLGAVMDHFEDDGIYVDAYGQTFEGASAVRDGLAILFDGTFGKPRYSVEEIFACEEDGKVLARWRCDAEMGGAPAVLHGLDVLHFNPSGQVTAKLAYLKAKEPLVVTE